MVASFSARVEVAMDYKKIERVRRQITCGFYTDTEVLGFIEEVLVEKKWDILVSDIENCRDICVSRNNCDQKAVGVYAKIVEELMKCHMEIGDSYHEILANIMYGSVYKLSKISIF